MRDKVFILICALFAVAIIAFILWPQPPLVPSMQSALTTSQQLECDYIDKKGMETKTYLKQHMLYSRYVDSNDNRKSGYLLMRDAMTYMWNVNAKEGFAAATADDNAHYSNQVLQSIDTYKDSCKEAVVSDALFVVPTDITFKDYFQTATAEPIKQK